MALYTKKECKEIWEDSKNFNRNPANSSLLKEVIELNEKVKRDKEELAKKRKELKDAMFGSVRKLFDLETKTSVSLSNNLITKTEKFDLEKFKENYPHLYKAYLVPSYSQGNGTLTIRKMTNSAIKYVTEFERYDESILPIEKVKEKHKIGTVLTMDDYIESVECGGFIPYDGWGVYLDSEGNKRDEAGTASFNVSTLKRVKYEFPYVLWFNK